MANATLTDKHYASMQGLTLFSCIATINGTTEVTVNTGLSKIVNIQLTFAEDPANGTTCELYVGSSSISGGAFNIDCAAASGAVTVYVLVLGFA